MAGAGLYVRAPKAMELAEPSPQLVDGGGNREAASEAVDKPMEPMPQEAIEQATAVETEHDSLARTRPAPSDQTGNFAFADFETVETEPPYRYRYDPVDEPIGKLREKGICRGRSGRRCSAIKLDVHESVRVLTFHTRDGALRGSCDTRHAPLSRRPREYEVQSLPGTRLSFYAVATRSASIARELANFIRHAPGSCRATNRPARWLARFDDFLSANEEAIYWRQIDIEKN